MMNGRMNSSATVAKVRRGLVANIAMLALGIGLCASMLGLGCVAATGEPITGDTRQAQQAQDGGADASTDDAHGVVCHD